MFHNIPLFVLENLDNFIIIIDKNLKIIVINKAALAFFKKTSAVVGSNYAELLKTADPYNPLLPTLLNLKNNKIKQLTEINAKNPKSAKNKYIIKWKMVAEKPTQKKPNLFFIIGTDITKTKKLEEKFKDIESRLDSVIESMPGNYWWKDLQGIYRGYNTNLLKTLGLKSKAEVIGKSDYDLPWKKQAAKLYENDNKVLATGKSYTAEEEVLSQTGKLMTFLVSKVPLRNGKGETIGTIGSSVDITQQKGLENDLRAAKEAAEAANKAKTEFLENIRHDLRTPLTGIIGFSNLIKAEANNAKIAEYADSVQASSHALLDLLNEVLEAMRITSGERPLLKKKFNLQASLEPIITLNLARAREKNLALTLNYDKSIPNYLIGDPKRLQRIVLELITNALNFTDSGSITVTAKIAQNNKRDAVIKLIVADTGTGIPADKREEIFERFKRLTPSYEGTHKGLGLGLAIVKQFIDDLDGEIYLQSKLNQGSTFTCTVPFKKALLNETFDVDTTALELTKPLLLPKKHENTVNAQNSPSSSATIRVLLVEDNALAAQVAAAILKNLDCLVDIAKDGKTALAFAKNYHYELIFMDIGLPDISGTEVTQQIRAWEALNNPHKRTPIIALTAHVEVENKKTCLNAGIDAVLAKPLIDKTAVQILNAFVPKPDKHLPTAVPTNLPEDKKTNKLFQLPNAVIDLELGTKLVGGNSELAKQILQELKDQSLPEECHKLTLAYQQQDWGTIQQVVHKLHGGACYCGTPRLKAACAHLETYLKTKKTPLREQLYQQLLQEITAVNNHGF